MPEKPKKFNLFALIVAIAFGAFGFWFLSTNQLIIGIIFLFFAFTFLKRIES